MYNMKDIDSNGIENAIAMGVFKECIENCRTCNALFTVTQGVLNPKGEMNTMTISEQVFPVVLSLDIQGDFIIPQLTVEDMSDVSKMVSDWETVLHRSTMRRLKNLERDYVLSIDLIKEKQDTPGDQTSEAEQIMGMPASMVYHIALSDPVFAARDMKTFSLCVPFDNVRFGTEKVDVVEIYNEERYAEEVARDDAKYEDDYFDDDNAAYNENSDVISNDDVLSNDEYFDEQ